MVLLINDLDAQVMVEIEARINRMNVAVLKIEYQENIVETY